MRPAHTAVVSLAAALLGAGVTGGCEPGDIRGRGPAVRDSAGISIVENPGAAWGPDDGWGLSPEPILQIGRRLQGEAPYLFHGILATRRLSDGRIAVVDRGSSEIRFFDGEGTFLHAVGGEGDGPGEFRFMSLFWGLPGDTLVVSDMRGLTVLDGRGGYVRLVRLGDPPAGAGAQPVGQLDDGTILGVGGSGRGPRPGEVGAVSRDTVRFYRFSADGSFLGPLRTFLGAERMGFQAGGRISIRRLPFSAHPAWAAAGRHFYVAGGAGAEVELWRGDGGLERIVRWSPAPRPVTDETLARYRDYLLESTDNADTRRVHEVFVAQAPVPNRLPVTGEVSAVLVDDVRNLWIASFRLPWEAQAEWVVLSPEGEWLGAVPMPASFTPHQVGSDFVLGGWRDELGAEFVRMYALEKRWAR